MPNYEGAGFNGTSAAESPLPGLVKPSPAAEADADSPHGRERDSSEVSPPALRCPYCNTNAKLFPSRRAWCPQCKASWEVRDEGSGSALTLAAFIGALLLLGFLLFYVQGAFDNHLYNIGLNWETCGLRHGETVCDGELRTGADTITESTKDGIESRIWRIW